MSTQKFATNALHAGHDVKSNSGTRAIPIYQSTSYVFDNSDHAANLFNLSETGFIYTRINNPTNDILEQRLAALEGGIAAVVTASGTAAISTTLLTLLKSGDHIVASCSAISEARFCSLASNLSRLRRSPGVRTAANSVSRPWAMGTIS